MTLPVALVMNWILFLALFPMAFIWLRRAHRIFLQKNYEEVALKRGEPPADAKKWAPYTGLVNLIAGLCAVWVIIGVPLYLFTGLLIGPFQDFYSWSGVAGVTIWGKIFADWMIRLQAHPFKFGRKPNQQ